MSYGYEAINMGGLVEGLGVSGKGFFVSDKFGFT